MSTLRSLNKTLLAAGLAVATLFSPLASQAAEKLKIVQPVVVSGNVVKDAVLIA